MAYVLYEQVECSDVVVRTVADLNVPGAATHAELQAQGDGDINYTMDGVTVPNPSIGMVLRATAPPKLFLIEDVNNIRFVRSAAGTHLNVHYSGGRNI